MNKSLLAIAAMSLGCAAPLVMAAPPPGGGRHTGPPGAYVGAGYRPFYPGYRPLYPGWRGGYWGPGVGIYVGGPGYWGGGAWPYAYGWGAGYAWPYAWPYAAAPLVVSAAAAPQVIMQPAAPAPEASATSYWYYCTQPAGYFPYVQDCTQQWMKVVPQVPGSATTSPRLAP